MAGRKRAAAEDTFAEKRETRSSKVAKTEGAKTAGKGAKGTARLKTSMAQSAFRSRAMPLYVNITTTAPPLEGQETTPADPGFLASTSLVPSTFATGSFGWKGHKRVMVELPNAEGGEGEKVHVTLTINATVIGSKDVREGEEHEAEKEEHAAEEASGEVAESKLGEPSPGGEGKEGEDNPPAGEEHAEESAS